MLCKRTGPARRSRRPAAPPSLARRPAPRNSPNVSRLAFRVRPRHILHVSAPSGGPSHIDTTDNASHTWFGTHRLSAASCVFIHASILPRQTSCIQHHCHPTSVCCVHHIHARCIHHPCVHICTNRHPAIQLFRVSSSGDTVREALNACHAPLLMQIR